MLGTTVGAPPEPLSKFQPTVTGKVLDKDLLSRVQHYFKVYEAHADDPMFLLRDEATYRDWYQTRWAVHRAIDAHKPLHKLEPYGLKAINGGYEIDLQQFPQWSSPESLLMRLRGPESFESTGYDLMERGFRQEDVLKLKQALTEGEPEAEARINAKNMLEQYTLRLQSRNVAKQMDDELAAAYRFQANRVIDETRRRWALRVLDVLDPKHQRTLLSYLLERPGVTIIYPAVHDEQEQHRYQQEVASGSILEATNE